ncbi:hypothetical protein [Priestia megaterium]|uniref:hypothetical protein n=1 Tax=Priestia megaterium TaxID=1404 RepID=UPI0018689218|nr:hypothetical protein [Priestia megaterium]MBE2973414.1 hypothetical protein [Priestia megaterium]
MRITDRSYPYPVLRVNNDDFQSSSFNCSLQEGKLSDEKFNFKINFLLNNKDLQKLINESKAFFGIHIECQRTRLRKVFKSTENYYEFSLKKTDCREKIEIRTFVIANSTINNYSSGNFNEDYEGVSFQVEKGSRLAVGTPYDIKIEENDQYDLDDPLFVIKNNRQLNAPALQVNSENEVVIVYLSQENFSICTGLVNIYGDFIASSIGIPVITYLVEKLKDEENNDKRWAKVLRNKIEELKLGDEESIVIANSILKDPLTKGINFMKYIKEQTQDQEEES